MKKILKSFTFWFVIFAIGGIYLHQIGRDSKSIALIYLNPVLNMISRSDMGAAFMNTGMQVAARTIAGHISVYWYIASILSFVLYGLILDGIKALFKRIWNRTK